VTGRSGSSSRSTRPVRNECPECDEGELVPQLITFSVTMEGQRVRVPSVIVEVCTACGAKAWIPAEVERARRVAELKVRRRAA
jgi:YgiT-type zinc finger domain-containing protein